MAVRGGTARLYYVTRLMSEWCAGGVVARQDLSEASIYLGLFPKHRSVQALYLALQYLTDAGYLVRLDKNRITLGKSRPELPIGRWADSAVPIEVVFGLREIGAVEILPGWLARVAAQGRKLAAQQGYALRTGTRSVRVLCQEIETAMSTKNDSEVAA